MEFENHLKTSIEKQNLIFFLDEKCKPSWILQMAELFNKYNYKLIGVNWAQFADFTKYEKNSPLIIPVINLAARTHFEKIAKANLERMMKMQKIVVFHLNSFPENRETKILKKHKNFFSYELPMDMNLLVKSIYENAVKIEEGQEAWPWKKGARLASSIMGR